jgi:hypothetical protein
MTPSEAMQKAIEDIKSINRLLDPKGQAWADEEKERRERREKSKALQVLAERYEIAT